ncbi:uncharacterized protein LOC132267554 [Cornus florida]|uniref:uncharacterized protein LOC132267554 n=1 Tax=Cornus florida TaxID=4283 RepID=UPI00289A6DAE|nr:uncharacterized protein LOC132267554 [Cornus florida]
MSDLKGNKKRLTINLSFFDNPLKLTTKSPKNLKPNSVVGLGIVAAMNELDQTPDPFSPAKSNRNTVLAVSPRSTAIPIVNINNNSSVSAKFSGVAKFGGSKLEEEMELSEGYTCVISHIGNNLITKREYFDGDLANGSESSTSYWMSSGVFSASSPPSQGHDGLRGDAVSALTGFQTTDFLSSSYLCKKKLHGLDIFMYRGSD